MSVADILHEIEALPQAERENLLQKLLEAKSLSHDVVPNISDEERAELKEKLAKRPSLGAELGQIIERMRAGHAVDLDDALALHQQLEKLGL